MLWQKVFEDPEVYLIQVPFQNVITTETNVYAIRSGEDVLLVDMGAPTKEASKALLDALGEIGVSLGHASIFFTHMHYDHAGLGCELPVCARTAYINGLEMRAAEPTFAKQLAKHVTERLMDEGMAESHAKEITALVELTTPICACIQDVHRTQGGDTIRVGDYDFQVIDLPGHTRGMQGLYQPDTGICFTGDQLLFLITPSVGLFLDDSDSLAAYEESMARLMNLEITHLFHSHGPIRRDFRERAVKIHDSRQKRMDRIVGIIEDAQREDYQPTGIEIIERIGWNIPYPSIDQCEARQQWLIYTQGIALLDHLVNQRRIVRKRTPAEHGNALFTNRYTVPTLVDNRYF